MSGFAAGAIIFLLLLNTILLAVLAYTIVQVAIQFQKSVRSLEARLDRLERVALPALESLKNIFAAIESGVRFGVAFRQGAASARSFATILEWAKALKLLDLLFRWATRFYAARKGKATDDKSDGEKSEGS